ncbi:MAG: hypothetical protein IPL38_09230 [Rhodobacter sp.]|nr:hypothetical protein [Rhodobacter sp.]
MRGFAPGFLTADHLRLRVDLWAAALWHPGIAATERALYARYRAALLDLLAELGGTEEARAEVADTVMAALDGLLGRLRPPAGRGGGAARAEGLRRPYPPAACARKKAAHIRQHPVRRLDEDRMLQAVKDHQVRPRQGGMNRAVQAGVAAAVQFPADDLGGGLHLSSQGAISVVG